MSIYVAPRPATPVAPQKATVGIGAGPLMTEWLLPMMLPNDPQRKAARAMDIANEVTYIAEAERVISGKVGGGKLTGGVQWHLEDPDGETIDEDYADPRAVEAYRLIEHPTDLLDVPTPVRTRRHLWEITSHHMGPVGYAWWVLDRMDDLGIPAAIMYVRPDRIVPHTDDKGNLIDWTLDPRPGTGQEGTSLEKAEVVPFYISPPSVGYLPVGLVESAILKAQLAGSIDKYFSSIISGGGRLSGIISPKVGTIDDDGVFQQMLRDWRNVTEQPESGKRVQITRGPIEFTKTVSTIVEMALIDFLKSNKSDIMEHWGVPLSQVGGYTPSGLNSGDVRKYDEAALWQNAVNPRLSELHEGIQSILDRWKPLLGWVPKLVLDVPEFDDDSPRYDKLQKAQFIALTEDERRGLIGYDPLDPTLIGPTGQPMGKEIWRPNTQSPVGIPPTPMQPEPDPTRLAQQLQAPAWSAYKPSPVAPSLLPTTEGGFGKAKPVTGTDVIPAVLAALKKQWPASELAIVRQGEWTFDPSFPIKKINAARRPIARNPKIVAGAEAVLDIGAPIAPITIIRTKVIGKPGYEPIDGWHRVLAAQHAGLKKIPAYVGEGDADWTTKLIAFDDDIPTPPDSAADEEPSGKAAFGDSMRRLRSAVVTSVTPHLQGAVASFLAAQKAEIVRRVREQAAHILARPSDHQVWWGRDDWNGQLVDTIKPVLEGVAQTVRDHVAERIAAPVKAAPIIAPAGAVTHVLTRGAARVTGINQTTRDGIAEIIAQAVTDGLSPAALGDAIETWSGWDEYRAERIATTEMAAAYNAAALGSYDEVGVTQVIAIDGTGDEECAARDGQTFDIGEADTIEDHPNGTLDWEPVIGSMEEPTE